MKHTNESITRTAEMKKQFGTSEGQSMANRKHAYPAMSAGSASGEGRLDKIAAYGDNAKPERK